MTLQVNGERLWSSLMEMARIGGTEKGGAIVKHLPTKTSRDARYLFAGVKKLVVPCAWMKWVTCFYARQAEITAYLLC